MDHRNAVADALEETIERAHLRAKIVLALSSWETWIVIGSVLYFYDRFSAWTVLLWRVVGR